RRYLARKRWTGGVLGAREWETGEPVTLLRPIDLVWMSVLFGAYEYTAVAQFMNARYLLRAVLRGEVASTLLTEEPEMDIRPNVAKCFRAGLRGEVASTLLTEELEMGIRPNVAKRSPSKEKTKMRANVTVHDQPIPVICFFGTKGGVGKTTIIDEFAALVSRAPSGPNVLLVDFDVHHRGLTVLRTKNRDGACNTIHEYMVDSNLEFSSAQDVTPPDEPEGRGRQFLIPSSKLASEKVFATLAKVKPRDLLARIREVIGAAA
ncbi:unnamed protein product, partial [marine sediment metagenome]